jgi:hypothetical protein
MNNRHFELPLRGALALFFSSIIFSATVFFSTVFFSIPRAAAQAGPGQAGVAVSMVVTVKGNHGAEANVSGENVIVTESKARARVTDWVPLQGERAGLELFLLLDDSRDTSLGTQVEDIRRFITAQPPTTKVGVAYLQDGGLKIVQSLTAEHALAAKAVHVTLSNLARIGSPYDSLATLIKQWPEGNDRREVLMISSGIDGAHEGVPADIYVNPVITEAQSAGVVVFAINTAAEESDSDRAGRGKAYLSQVAEQTGGESYYRVSSGSIAPYLDDATHRLERQYLLTFLAKPGKKAGMQSVKVRTDMSHTELASAEKVFVPAGGQ